MYHSYSHFNSKNPFLKKLEDTEAIKAVYLQTLKPPVLPLTHSSSALTRDNPLVKGKLNYSKYSLAHINRQQLEAESLGKRLVKDYFDGVDLSIYARCSYQVRKR